MLDLYRHLSEADPIYWETLREHPMMLRGLTYPGPALPPATGPIVLGEVVTTAIAMRTAVTA